MEISRAFSSQRRLKNLPVWILPLLLITLACQIIWHLKRPDPTAEAQALEPPPSPEIIQILSLGEQVSISKIVMLWLQAHDNQAGHSIPFRKMDYTIISQWLMTILALDPKFQYPLLSAVRVFAEVPDPVKKRQMLDFVETQFLLDPNRRWPWLAHAAFVAKHRLKDSQLALRYARLLAEYATGENVPSWAKQMQILLLADMGEVESARVLLGGLLNSGQLKDPNERAFLQRRLEHLEKNTSDQ